MHVRNVYLVLNLITGCVSPQYHCCFNDFFETTCHGGPDVSGTICWQQLAGLDRANTILLEVSTPTPHSVTYPETPSEAVISLAGRQICECTDDQLGTFFSDCVFCADVFSLVFLLCTQEANAQVHRYGHVPPLIFGLMPPNNNNNLKN